MTTRHARVLATTGVAHSAGMVGSQVWQWVFLLAIVSTMAAGTWMGHPPSKKV